MGMGKGNKNKNNQRRDPMTNVKTMGREGMRMIRDIAFGKFNFYNEGHVFRNIEFTKATLNEVDKKILDLSIHITAITYAYGNNTVSMDPSVANLLYRDQKSLSAYNIIRTTLCSIIVSGGDTGFLQVLCAQLPAYRYNI